MPHDAQQFALPGLQARRRLLEKIQQVFLRQAEQLRGGARRPASRSLFTGPAGTVRHKSLKALSSCGAAPARPLFLGAKIELLLAGIAVDAVRHQRVRGIERVLDRQPAVALLAMRHVALGEFEIVEDAVGIGPLLEQIVVLEEMVVAERGMRDHQRLHRRGIFFHQVGNARRRS